MLSCCARVGTVNNMLTAFSASMQSCLAILMSGMNARNGDVLTLIMTACCHDMYDLLPMLLQHMRLVVQLQ